MSCAVLGFRATPAAPLPRPWSHLCLQAPYRWLSSSGSLVPAVGGKPDLTPAGTGTVSTCPLDCWRQWPLLAYLKRMSAQAVLNATSLSADKGTVQTLRLCSLRPMGPRCHAPTANTRLYGPGTICAGWAALASPPSLGEIAGAKSWRISWESWPSMMCSNA